MNAKPEFLSKITSPQLLLDAVKCRNNISRMAEKAQRHGLAFRPHFKTHQSMVIGNWFREAGIESITVSSVKMATYFSSNGWKNITIAFPVNLLEIDEINSLAAKINLNLIVGDLHTLHKLQRCLKSKTGVFIEIDTGAHRSGADPTCVELLDEMIEALQGQGAARFSGLLSHAGHTYKAQNIGEVCEIQHHERRIMEILGTRYRSVFPDLIISTGDTPSCSVCNEFSGVNEIRPGNFVFYDVMQAMLGSCTLGDLAIALACPVVAVNRSRNEVVLYGGAIHLSKDYVLLPDGSPMFGYLAKLSGHGWEFLPSVNYIKSLSQEHAVANLSDLEINNIRPEEILLVLPVHACLTAHQMRRYCTFDGQVIQMMEI